MKYDDASWHCDGDFPEGQPEEHGGTHIALFLKWCVTKGWAGDLLVENEPEALKAVMDGTMSATDFLFTYCDGKLIDDMLNEAGNAFAERYYGDSGLYFQDYADHFGELMYVAPEAAHDFRRFTTVLDARLQSGVLTKD